MFINSPTKVSLDGELVEGGRKPFFVRSRVQMKAVS